MTRWRIAVGAGILCAAGVATAGPHFLSATASINGFGDLVASFKEAGLGSTPVTYDLSATSCRVVYECVNKGSNVAPGQPTVSDTNVSDLTTCTPHNGTISSPTGPCTVALACGATPN